MAVNSVIDTRYHCPAQSAMPSGKRVVWPLVRPRTSRVTHRGGSSPSPCTVAQNRANRRAVRSPRPPTYTARSSSSENGHGANVDLLRSAPSNVRTCCSAAPRVGSATDAMFASSVGAQAFGEALRVATADAAEHDRDAVQHFDLGDVVAVSDFGDRYVGDEVIHGAFDRRVQLSDRGAATRGFALATGCSVWNCDSRQDRAHTSTTAHTARR